MNQAEYSRILDGSPCLIAEVSQEGEIFYISQACERVLGFSSESLKGKKWDAVFFGGDGEVAGECLKGVLAGRGEKFFAETKTVAQDGYSRDLHLVANAIFSSDGNFRSIVVNAMEVSFDLSESKRLCDELAEGKRIAEEESVRKAEFLADMSHEIRTPMNSVIGFSKLLLDSELTGEQRRHIEVLRNSGEALLLLVNDILDFSKIEEGKLGVEKTVFDLMGKLEEGVDALAVRAAEKKLELIFFPDFSLPRFVEGDPGRLLQIINNLVGNAIKFTEEGTITLGVRLESRRESGMLLRFSIRDTGIGIPQEKQEMLFQRFSQGDSTISRRFGGSGLGLTISRKLAELMGGEIGVLSKEGEGAEFWFTVMVGEVGGEVLESENDLKILSGKKALVFDRSEKYREVIQAHLLDWGMEVHGVDSPDSLQREVRKSKAEGKSYDVVFIDMTAATKNGGTDVMPLWSSSVFLGVRTVNVRPFGQSCSGACKREGYSACIGKPLRHSELGNVLSRLFLSGGSWRCQERGAWREGGGRRKFEKLDAHVLLVEDYLANQILAQALFEKMGMTCDILHNGRDAIFAIETIGYDLVFMDVQMPVMDGLTAAREIRRKHHGSQEGHLPIIAMTAQALPEDRERCLAAGMDDYISKPIEEDILFEVSKKWLKARGKHRDKNFGGEAREGTEEVFSESGGGSIYDPEGLRKALGGDLQFIARFLKTFLKGASADLEKIRGFIGSGDFAKVQRIAHNLKGTSGYFHSPRYKSAVESFGETIKKGENEKAIEEFCRLEREYENLRQAVSRDFLGEEGEAL